MTFVMHFVGLFYSLCNLDIVPVYVGACNSCVALSSGWPVLYYTTIDKNGGQLVLRTT